MLIFFCFCFIIVHELEDFDSKHLLRVIHIIGMFNEKHISICSFANRRKEFELLIYVYFFIEGYWWGRTLRFLFFNKIVLYINLHQSIDLRLCTTEVLTICDRISATVYLLFITFSISNCCSDRNSIVSSLYFWGLLSITSKALVG